MSRVRFSQIFKNKKEELEAVKNWLAFLRENIDSYGNDHRKNVEQKIQIAQKLIKEFKS